MSANDITLAVGKPMSQELVLNIFCAAVAMAGVAVAAWVVVSGQIGKQGLDAVFLAVVSLAIALMFGLIPLNALRQAKLKPGRGKDARDTDDKRPAE